MTNRAPQTLMLLLGASGRHRITLYQAYKRKEYADRRFEHPCAGQTAVEIITPVKAGTLPLARAHLSALHS
jgi:hypothetical protein